VELEGPFEAYRLLFRGPWFGRSLGFTAAVASASAVLSVLIGTVLAYMVWRLPVRLRRGADVYRIPLVIPHIVVAFIVIITWSQTGLISSLANRIGLVSEYTRFPDIIYRRNGIALTAAYIYKEVPFVMLMVLSVLRRMDRKQIDTARMLGGGEVPIFIRIVVPFLLPVIHSVFVILFVYSFGAFDIPFILGKSEPSMLSVKMFDLYFARGLENRPVALASLVVVFVLSLISMAVYFTVMKMAGLRERRV
jgi:putative spermidine/putrescine transport system permease protein